MPNGNKINPKTTREHLLSIYGYITGLKKDVKHMHDGIHDLGGKIDKIYWVLLGTVGAVSLLLLEKVLERERLATRSLEHLVFDIFLSVDKSIHLLQQSCV